MKYTVLKPFTSVSRRFSPAVTAEVTTDELLVDGIPIETYMSRGFFAPVDGGQSAVAETMAGASEPAPEPVPAKRKSAA